MLQSAARQMLSRPVKSQLLRRAMKPRAISGMAVEPFSLDFFDVDFRNPLGEGSFGSVFPAQHRITGDEVAMKVVSPGCIPENGRLGHTELIDGIDFEHRLFEQVVEHDIKHPNVVDLVGCFQGSAEEAADLGLDLPPAAFEEPLHYFVMELLQGESLEDHVERSKGLQEDEVRNITRVLCKGLDFLHRNGIVHRDVKPGNLHYACQNKGVASLKLIDFSTAGLVAKGTPTEAAVFDEMVGTPGYVAPEVLYTQKGGTYNAKCDTFSVGCAMHAMLTNMYLPRRHPHVGIITNTELSNTLSPEGHDFLKFTLAENPEERPSIAEALHHPWLVDGH